MTEKPHTCEQCGTGQTPEEYVAVGPSTPAARQLALGEPSQDTHHVVCNECFETASDQIQARGDGEAETA